MNFYLFLTIALSALTGVVEAPVARPAFSAVRAERGIRVTRRASKPIAVEGTRTSRAQRLPRLLPLLARLTAPLTGSLSPRAPAVG